MAPDEASIESYEPYHIGIKLKPYVDLMTLKKHIKSKLSGKGYTVSDDVAPNVQTISENLGTKKDVGVVLNVLASAVNSIGRNPRNVFEIFNEISNLIREAGYDETATIHFYEIIASINIKTKSKPIDILNKNCKYDLKDFGKYGKLDLLGIRMANKLQPGATSEFAEVAMEPKLTNPDKILFMRVLYRAQDKEGLKEFHDNIEKYVRNIIKQF